MGETRRASGISPLISTVRLPISASTENELIVNNLESIDEKRGPEKKRAEVNKYTTYAALFFGACNPTLARGVYGSELQNATRRQPSGTKHTRWDLRTRSPNNKRIASGMAVMR